MNTKETFEVINRQLKELDMELMGGAKWREPGNEAFAASGVIIAASAPAQTDPAVLRVVSPDWHSQLSRLFMRLSGILTPVLDSRGERELFRRLANAAIRSEPNSSGAVFAAAHEAYAFANDLENACAKK